MRKAIQCQLEIISKFASQVSVICLTRASQMTVICLTRASQVTSKCSPPRLRLRLRLSLRLYANHARQLTVMCLTRASQMTVMCLTRASQMTSKCPPPRLRLRLRLRLYVNSPVGSAEAHCLAEYCPSWGCHSRQLSAIPFSSCMAMGIPHLVNRAKGHSEIFSCKQL